MTGSTQVKSAVVMSAGQSSGRAIDRGRARRKRLKRRGQPFCLRATLANFSTFCQQTSLHGWQYIAQKNSSSAKHMFWAVVVSMSMATAALFLYNNTMDYLNATVRANFYLKSRDVDFRITMEWMDWNHFWRSILYWTAWTSLISFFNFEAIAYLKNILLYKIQIGMFPLGRIYPIVIFSLYEICSRYVIYFHHDMFLYLLLSFLSQNLTFKVNFLCQKSSESFSIFFSLKNTNLGAHFLLLTLFDNINFSTTLLLKLGQIFDEVAKLGKSTQDTYNRGWWLILWDLLKNWVAKGVASDVNDFTTYFHMYDVRNINELKFL